MLTRQMWRWLKLREHVPGGRPETTIVARVNMAPGCEGSSLHKQKSSRLSVSFTEKAPALANIIG